jgi:hypothetical protein
MQGTQFAVAFHVPGTLAADLNIRFTAPKACQLIHVSAVGSNSNNGIIDIGPSTDTDAYVDGADIGDSNVPAEYDQDDFEGDEFPHIAAGTIICITLDHDGDGGTAAQNFTVVLTFTEG